MRDEYWKYTNVLPIAQKTFHFVKEQPNISYEDFNQFSFQHYNWPRLVFVDGIFSAPLSSQRRQNGLITTHMKEQLFHNASFLEPYIGRYADFKRHAFTALNTAFATDGAFIYVSEKEMISDPIHLVFISTAENDQTSIVPIRNVIVLDPGAKASVIENYISVGKNSYFNNVVTEIVVKENASLEHYKMERENEQAFHVSTTQVHLAERASFSSASIALGGALVRNNIDVKLQGEGAQVSLNGLYMVSGSQHVDHHTLIDHPRPNGTSRQLYKGLLSGKSTGVFSGKVYVHEGAQKTDAQQVNKNLLLSKEATMNTKPQLEILADDVKCTHGAAVGQLEDEAIFYLKTRGIDPYEAAKLLSFGFTAEVLDSISIPELKGELSQIISERLNDPAYLPPVGNAREQVLG